MHLIATKNRSRSADWQTVLPSYQIVRGYAREMKRVHPTWSLRGCIRNGYEFALDAMNPKEKVK